MDEHVQGSFFLSSSCVNTMCSCVPITLHVQRLFTLWPFNHLLLHWTFANISSTVKLGAYRGNSLSDWYFILCVLPQSGFRGFRSQTVSEKRHFTVGKINRNMFKLWNTTRVKEVKHVVFFSRLFKGHEVWLCAHVTSGVWHISVSCCHVSTCKNEAVKNAFRHLKFSFSTLHFAQTC